MHSSEKKNSKVSKKKENEALSLNHGKDLKFRKRMQDDKERDEELKEFLKEDDNKSPRVW